MVGMSGKVKNRKSKISTSEHHPNNQSELSKNHTSLLNRCRSLMTRCAVRDKISLGNTRNTQEETVNSFLGPLFSGNN